LPNDLNVFLTVLDLRGNLLSIATCTAGNKSQRDQSSQFQNSSLQHALTYDRKL